MKKQCRVEVRGEVQGVGFRYTARQEAKRLGLCGWVANRRDGAVVAVLEGEEGSLTRMLRWLESGPPGAVVTSCRIVEEGPAQGMEEFRITGLQA